MKKLSLVLLCILVTAALLTAGAGGVQAGLKTTYLNMDAFKPIFQPLTGDTYARHYPSALGGRTLPLPPLRSYGGCAVLQFKSGTLLREITHVSQGDSGQGFVYLQEYRYNEINQLLFDDLSFPADAGENELLSPADAPVRIEKGYSYYICVEGFPGLAAGNYNQFTGFKILYQKR